MPQLNGTSTLELLQEIQKMSNEGKKLSPAQRDRLLMKFMEVSLKTQIEHERKLNLSIGVWINQNPKLSAFLASIGFLLANLWFIPGLRKPIMIALGLNSDLIP